MKTNPETGAVTFDEKHIKGWVWLEQLGQTVRYCLNWKGNCLVDGHFVGKGTTRWVGLPTLTADKDWLFHRINDFASGAAILCFRFPGAITIDCLQLSMPCLTHNLSIYLYG